MFRRGLLVSVALIAAALVQGAFPHAISTDAAAAPAIMPSAAPPLAGAPEASIAEIEDGPQRPVLPGVGGGAALDPPAAASSASSAVSTKPNIVVFYLDDVNPHDGRLWSDASLTPALHHYFVEQGTQFSAAIGETPLCCPGRAGLLTSLHTHNHGVQSNDARLLNPGEHIGRAMKRAGYASMFIGKYLNKNSYLTTAQWQAHGAGWTHLDVIKGYNGQYYGYKVWTKTGMVRYDEDHSTRMVGERAVARMRQTDPGVPVFAILSAYNLHAPNTPMPEFAGDQRCSSVPSWQPPNYNEADVSDKHPFIRALPLLTATDGWPMAGYCREMLGIDWLVATVTDELEAQGRLDNTLLVFTADNGSTWGMHRMPQKKLVPQAAQVPLAMWWPAEIGTQGGRIHEPVSNIDLGPTFCAIAGCIMGPYPTGQVAPDGASLLPLIDGSRTKLARQGVLERAWAGTRTWAAVRTGSTDPLGAWHYVEWEDGFHELYDLEADRWELENRARDASLAAIRASLAERLAELRLEGVGARPDASIGKTPTSVFVGNGIYATEPLDSQTVKRLRVAAGSSYSFTVRLENDGTLQDDLSVHGEIRGTAGVTASYSVAGVDVTTDVASGSYVAHDLAAGERVDLTVVVHVPLSASAGSRGAVLVRAASIADPGRVDAVRAMVVR